MRGRRAGALALGRQDSPPPAPPKYRSARYLGGETPFPTFPHFEVQKWGKGKKRRPGRGAFGRDGRG